MGRKEFPSIFGQIEANRLKKKERNSSIAAAEAPIRSLRVIIDRLMEGRELSQNPDFPNEPALYLTMDPNTQDSISVIVKKTAQNGSLAPVYNIHIQDIEKIASLHSSYGFIVRSGLNEDGTRKERKPIKFDVANNYLHFFEIIEAGVQLGGVQIENPLIQTPKPVEELPF